MSFCIKQHMEQLSNPKRRITIEAAHAIHYVGRKKWDIISRNSGLEMELWKSLYDQGKNIKSLQSRLIYCGNNVYLNMRALLVKNRVVINETAIKPNVTENGNRANQIQVANILKKCRTELDVILKSSLASYQFKMNKYVELNLIQLMLYLKNLLVNVDRLAVISLIITAQIIINASHTSEISNDCINDVNDWIVNAKQVINFDLADVIVNQPQLIFTTNHGIFDRQIDLYPSQREIMDFVTNNDKYLALVHTMLGSGKTSLILPLVGWLISVKDPSKIIFCCPNEIVLLEVARMVYRLGVSFAIIVQNENRLDYKWSSFSDKKKPHDTAVLYIGDVFSIRMLLDERMTKVTERNRYLRAHHRDPINYPLTKSKIPVVPDYIFIGDELTKDADTPTDLGFSITTEYFVHIMKIVPPRTILMSATLPTIHQLPDFYHTISQNQDMIIKSFTASEAKIGCALISSTGELYAPHINITTVEMIHQILHVIKSNPFIGRFYTFEVLLHMINDFKRLHLPTPDLAVVFNDVTKVNQVMIQQLAYDMLQTLTSYPDLITPACATFIAVKYNINLNRMLTLDIGHFAKGCLIFSSDPVMTATTIFQANFDKFLEDSNLNIFQQIRLENILEKYRQAMVNYNKNVERVKTRNPSQKDKNQLESWKTLSTLHDERPQWEFPKQLQLYSREHLLKSNVDAAISENTVSADDIPDDSSVPIEILFMLAAGIGIYSTVHASLDNSYLQTVLSLAHRGVVKVIFSDSSIAYGTNLSVANIVVVDEPVNESIVDRHSMKTIFQMLGRAGRGGVLAYEATVYTTSAENHLIKKINNYIAGTLDEGSRDEIQNINRAFQML